MELTPCLKFFEHRLSQSRWEAAPIPREFQEREGKAELLLRSYSWVSATGSDARCAYLVGPRAEILNLMIYPRHGREVPVFALEIILFGQQPRVAVVDLQPVQGRSQNPVLWERLEREIAPLHQRYSRGLGEGGELPAWAEDHFTPWAIYSRPRSLAELAQVLRASEHYLDVWLDRFEQGQKDIASDEAALRRYQEHHREHTPGRRFLVTSFGSDWTEAYLADFMYPGYPPPPVPLPTLVGAEVGR